MRRLLGLTWLCSSLALIAAAPSPSPSPAPVFTPQAPVVLVYPFDVQTGVDSKIGMAIAQILAKEMTAAGGITVPNVPEGVKRPDFLANARSQHADFYISGYVTPVGEGAAVVEQVVSVDSGIILFSQTAQVSSVADVASQSLQARAQILAYVNHVTQNVQTQASSTPAPTSTNGAKMQIKGLSSIVDSVFKHKGAATPTPGPVVKPSRGVIVTHVTAAGSLPANDLANSSNELYFAMNRHFTTQVTGLTSNVAKTADAICGSNRNNTIATGTLGVNQESHHRQEFVFTLAVYTCFGALLDHTVGKGSSIKGAIDAAASAYATAHPDNS